MKMHVCSQQWSCDTNENHAELITGEASSITDNRFEHHLCRWAVTARISVSGSAGQDFCCCSDPRSGVVVKLWILCDGRAPLHGVHQQGGSVASRRNANRQWDGKHFHNNDSETAAARRFKRPCVTLHFNNAAASSLISVILQFTALLLSLRERIQFRICWLIKTTMSRPSGSRRRRSFHTSTEGVAALRVFRPPRRRLEAPKVSREHTTADFTPSPSTSLTN